jgi:prepilin-type N-terminal cleavage/methylation domain-containing protein
LVGGVGRAADDERGGADDGSLSERGAHVPTSYAIGKERAMHIFFNNEVFVEAVKLRKKTERRRRGFTLVEVIIVLVIIAILAAIAIPALAGYIDKASDTERKSILNTATKAIQTWASERYADNLIGQDALVKVADDPADAAAGVSRPVDPGTYSSLSPSSATTWLGIVEEYAKLKLDPDEWAITNVEFDNKNKLTGLSLVKKNSDAEDSEQTTTFGGGELFSFTISVADGAFIIPTSGYDTNGSQSVAYDWSVSVDGGTAQRYTGTGGASSGISLSGLSSGTHTIKIQQYGVTEKEKNSYQWFRAFGRGADSAYETEIVALTSPLPEKGLNVANNDAGNNYALGMFRRCTNASFTMGSAFTIPPGITKVGNSFCYRMFEGCNGAAFTMNALFNLPQKIRSAAGREFCASMFYSCGGANFNMNGVFNLPPSITGTVGNNFCTNMFRQCTDVGFTMNSGFNLPQGISGISAGFCTFMFTEYGPNFYVNNVFRFPDALPNDAIKSTSDTTSYMFAVTQRAANIPTQTREASAIINGQEARDTRGYTFTVNTSFTGTPWPEPDYSNVAANWK